MKKLLLAAALALAPLSAWAGATSPASVEVDRGSMTSGQPGNACVRVNSTTCVPIGAVTPGGVFNVLGASLPALGGDVSCPAGSPSNCVVNKINGQPPAALPVGGDLSGTAGAATVSKIAGQSPAAIATSGKASDLQGPNPIPSAVAPALGGVIACPAGSPLSCAFNPLQVTGGSASRNLVDKLGDQLDLKDKGAQVGMDVSNAIGSLSVGRYTLTGGQYLISANVTVPAGVILKVAPGSSLCVAANTTLQFSGDQIDHDIFTQIFYANRTNSGACSGAVQGLTYNNPLWWGARNSYGWSTGRDDSAAINAALASASSNPVSYNGERSKVILDGIFYVCRPVDWYLNIYNAPDVFGRASVAQAGGIMTCPTFTGTSYPSGTSNGVFNIHGAPTGTTAIFDIRLHDLSIQDYYTAVVPTVTSAVTNGTVIPVSSASGISTGQSVSGAGVPNSTTVVSVNGLNVTVSQAVTITANNLVTFKTLSGATAGVVFNPEGAGYAITGIQGQYVDNVSVQNFSQDWVINNTRYLEMHRPSAGQTGTGFATGLIVQSLGTNGFSGDLDVYNPQFNMCTGHQQSGTSCNLTKSVQLIGNAGSFGIGGIRFWAPIFYGANYGVDMSISGGATGGDIWLHSPQWDGAQDTFFRAIASAPASGGGVAIGDIHVANGYGTGNNGAAFDFECSGGATCIDVDVHDLWMVGVNTNGLLAYMSGINGCHFANNTVGNALATNTAIWLSSANNCSVVGNVVKSPTSSGGSGTATLATLVRADGTSDYNSMSGNTGDGFTAFSGGNTTGTHNRFSNP